MERPTFRIVHFSDVHVGSAPCTLDAWFDKRLLGSLNYYLRRRRQTHLEHVARAAAEIQRLNPDAIVCTGDLTSTGTPSEFSHACSLLKPVRQVNPDRFIYVPGNHDAYVPDPVCRESLREAFSLLNGGRFELDALPVRRRIGDATFLLMSAAHPTSPFVCSGTLREESRDILAAWLAEPRGAREPRVLLNHFPLRTAGGAVLPARRFMHGSDWLENQLQAGLFDAALCGHIHRPYVRRLAPGRIEVCAGSLTIAGKLSVLDYSFETGQFTHFWVDVSADRAEPIPLVEELAAVPVE